MHQVHPMLHRAYILAKWLVLLGALVAISGLVGIRRPAFLEYKGIVLDPYITTLSGATVFFLCFWVIFVMLWARKQALLRSYESLSTTEKNQLWDAAFPQLLGRFCFFLLAVASAGMALVTLFMLLVFLI